MADYLFIRYSPHPTPGHLNFKHELFWIEFKRPGESPKPHQSDWHADERRRGAVVLVEDDPDDFIAWYKASALYRRKNL